MGSGSSALQTKVKDATTAEVCATASGLSKEDREKIVAALSKLEAQTARPGDAGAAHTYPQQAGEVKEGSHLMIKGRPCKCVEVSKSKKGKDGPEKALIVAIDIFTGKRMEFVCPASDNVEVPFVKSTKYEVLNADAETGELSLMQENGDTKDDLNLPCFVKTGEPTEEDKKIQAEILDEFDKGEKSVFAIVQVACGEEKIVGIKYV